LPACILRFASINPLVSLQTTPPPSHHPTQHCLVSAYYSTQTSPNPPHTIYFYRNGFLEQRLLLELRPTDRGGAVLQSGVPARRPGEGWPDRGPDELTAVDVRFFNIVFEQRLLPAAGRQLLVVQGTLELKGIRHGPGQPALLSNSEWHLLRAFRSSKAVTATQPDAFFITVITGLFLVTDSIGCLATSRHPASELHAVVRPNARHEETV
jgi:hypothetical protein